MMPVVLALAVAACSSGSRAPATVGLAPTPVSKPSPADASPSAYTGIKHIFVVILENESGASAARDPYLAQLAARGATLTHYYGVAHPSQPNYIAILAGATLVEDDASHDLARSNLVDLLESANRSWTAYQEGYPGGCFSGETAGDAKTGTYTRKHNPFISFNDIRTNAARCANIVNAAQLDSDIARGQLPDFSFYTPNLDDSGHDTPLSFASGWLRGFLEPKLADRKFTDGTLVVVTFDEGAGDPARDPLYAVLLGPMVVPGSVDANTYNHYSLLRSIEDALGLGSLGREDAKSHPFAPCNFVAGCRP
jgi:hypothetical protein